MSEAAAASGGEADAAASEAAAGVDEAAGGALLAAGGLDAAPPPPEGPQLQSRTQEAPRRAVAEVLRTMAYLAVIMIEDTQPRLPVSSSTSHQTPFFWPVGKTLSPAWNWRTTLAVGEAEARMAMFCLVT